MVFINTGKTIRFNRFFREDGRTLIAALDHGGEDALIEGIENLGDVLDKVIRGGIDAVLINEGALVRYSGDIKGRVPVVLNIPLSKGFVVHALSLGADAVKTTYFGEIPLEQSVADRMRTVAKEALDYGIPYINELIVLENGAVSNNPVSVARGARVAAEYGADIVKTSYVSNFKIVTESVPVPVIIAGGGAQGTNIKEVLKDVIRNGGAGGAIGRNIFQSPDPKKTVEELIKIVHGGGK
ncbi:MAG: hypothetical protein QXM60_05725 [Thermoplasmatales archaeon]